MSTGPTEAAPPLRRARVVMFHRKPTQHVFSIEQVFELVRSQLPDRFEPVVAVSSHPSRGILPRVRSIREARGRQGDVNHVVGDVNFLALGLDGARTVLTVHDCEFLERAGRLKSWIYRWVWLRLPIRRSRIITVPTEAVREEVLRHVSLDRDRIRVIPDPVAPVFSPTARPFRIEEPVILQVGTRSNKNLERVVRALEGIPCRLVVIGPLTADQRRLLAACRVRYEQLLDLSIDEVARCYRDCDLVIFASTAEGFGLPILEAQASGRPLVVGDHPPLPEVAGDGACLVDPIDVSSIRAGIRRVIDDADYREGLVRMGVQNVARFDATAIAERYAAVYDEIVATVRASSS